MAKRYTMSQHIEKSWCLQPSPYPKTDEFGNILNGFIQACQSSSAGAKHKVRWPRLFMYQVLLSHFKLGNW